MHKYEQLIEEHDSLRKLLIDNDISKESEFYSVGFDHDLKAFIEDRYLKSFSVICTRALEYRNTTKLNALVHSVSFLATDRVIKELVPNFVMILQSALNDLSFLEEHLDQSRIEKSIKDSIEKKVERIYGDAVLEICNDYHSFSKVNELRRELLERSFALCDRIAGNASIDRSYKSAVKHTIIIRLKRFKVDEHLKNHFDQHDEEIDAQVKKSKKGVKIITILVAVLLVFRLLRLLFA